MRKDWQCWSNNAGLLIKAEAYYPLKLANLVTAWQIYSTLLTPVADSRNRS